MANELVTPETLRFLRELAANNDRAWFALNKQRYLDEVRDPLLRFVDHSAAPLAKISRHIRADSRPVGGSLFRIYRDTRFSLDKRPYKTAAAVHFRHDAEGDVHGPGYYLHVEPGHCFVAGGVWRPPPEALRAVRDAIVARPKEWQRMRRAVKLDDPGDDALKRPPQGYDPASPFVEDLKRKSFTASRPLTDKQVCAPDFPARFAATCKEMVPMMTFLCRAMDLRW